MRDKCKYCNAFISWKFLEQTHKYVAIDPGETAHYCRGKEYSHSYWTVSYLVDKLKHHLATIDLSKSKENTDLLYIHNDKFNKYFCRISNRHYVNQAFHYLKIGVLRPVPEFLISMSDLSPKLIKELAELDKKTRDLALKQAVGRIFEDINSQLYHNSISSVLSVRLVQ